MFDYNSYVEAGSVEEAVGYLTGHLNARVIAGGTDVLIKLRERSGQYIGCDLVGIARIPALKRITEGGGCITIGSAVTFTHLENDPLIQKFLPGLVKAAGSVGGPQIRNMGTIGGNIANGAPSADIAPILFTHNAIIIIQNKDGTKELPISAFYKGPGKVGLSKGDLLAAVKINKCDYEGFKGEYIKFSPRNAMDIATLGCAVLIKTAGGLIQDLRIAFGVAGPTPLRAFTAEGFAAGMPLTEETFKAIGVKCLEDTKARDSWRGSKSFREQLIQVLPGKAINSALA